MIAQRRITMSNKTLTKKTEISGETAASAQAHLQDTVASTPVDLAKFGLAEIAYIRRAIVNDVPMWTIHSASGDPLGAAHTFDQAWAAVKQNDLEPVRVH
jgi:hypothetical protein